jgi:hypothetical protein
MKTIATIAALAIAYTTTSASAQNVGYVSEGVVPNVAVTGFYGGGFYNGWGNGGGTVAGNFLQGAADLVRAEGDNAYMNSLANINNQIALKQNIENREQWVETYFKMRRTNDAYRASIRRGPVSQGESETMAKVLLPKRLNGSQLEPLTGRIHWPAALQGDEYALARRQLDRLFAGRTVHNAGIGGALDSSVASITGEMRERLKAQIHTMTASEYLAGKKFIDSLGYEARFAPGVEGLAAN